MTKELFESDRNNRIGNVYPKSVDDNSDGIISRNSMLFSYHNTVDTTYIGDIRHFAMKVGDYLRDSKSKVYDVKQSTYIDIPIKYAAPNLVFSDNTPITPGATGVFPQSSLTDRIVLPVISYFMTSMQYDNTRAIDPVVRFRYKPKKSALGVSSQDRVLVSHAPMPMNYEYQIDIWCDYREHYHQLLSAFLLDFNPYSYLTDLYDFGDETQKSFYAPYARMTLVSNSDQSNFIPGSERRVVRGTIRVKVEGWLTPPIKDTPLVKPVPAVIEPGDINDTFIGI